MGPYLAEAKNAQDFCHSQEMAKSPICPSPQCLLNLAIHPAVTFIDRKWEISRYNPYVAWLMPSILSKVLSF